MDTHSPSLCLTASVPRIKKAKETWQEFWSSLTAPSHWVIFQDLPWPPTPDCLSQMLNTSLSTPHIKATDRSNSWALLNLLLCVFSFVVRLFQALRFHVLKAAFLLDLSKRWEENCLPRSRVQQDRHSEHSNQYCQYRKTIRTLADLQETEKWHRDGHETQENRAGIQEWRDFWWACLPSTV